MLEKAARADRIELHCEKCNRHLMDYVLTGMDDSVVLQNIEVKCDRCKRMMMKKYTEKILRIQARGNVFLV